MRGLRGQPKESESTSENLTRSLRDCRHDVTAPGYSRFRRLANVICEGAARSKRSSPRVALRLQGFDMTLTTRGASGRLQGPTDLQHGRVALTPRPMPGLPGGAFYAVDDDQRVSAFAWDALVRSLGLDAREAS